MKTLDINGDLRVERHEIKQAVKLASPDMENDRKIYLDEIARFKDMVKACDTEDITGNRGDGEIDFEEGQACLNENVSILFKHNGSKSFKKLCDLQYIPHCFLYSLINMSQL